MRRPKTRCDVDVIARPAHRMRHAVHVSDNAADVFVNAFSEQDLLIRTTGDIIALSPPLIISESQIGELVDRVRRAISAVA